jgi:hypothetical protein
MRSRSALPTGTTIGYPTARAAAPDGSLLVADTTGYLGAPTI